MSAIRCEIDFPELATLTPSERLRKQFTDPVAVHVATEASGVAAVMDAVQRAATAGHWCVGFVAHEAAPAFDPALSVQGISGTPLAWFAEFTPDAMRAGPLQGHGTFEVGTWRYGLDYGRYADCIESIRRDIHDGRFYQVNFTDRLAAPFAGDALAFFRALQAEQPNGYHAFLDTGEGALLSLSPELFFTLHDGHVTTQPMKGTAPRGDTPEEDDRIAWALTHSDKERAENLMIVDLLRNDLSRLAKPNSVEVASLFALQPLPSVWQMTSTINAELRDGLGLAEVFRALFPCGSVTGAPKVEATRAIRDLEAAPRGAYCGAVGYVAPDAGGPRACFNVGIRTLWLRGGTATCGVGGGITYDSTVEGEWAELQYKGRFAVRASRPFELLETLKLENGEFALLERHLDRMEKSARHFRFAFDRGAARQALAEAAASAGAQGTWRVRLLGDRAGRLHAERHALGALPADPVVRLAAVPVSSADEFLRHKTTRRETYERQAPAGQAEFDTLLVNERGELTEFTRANLALVIDGVTCTPPLTAGLLDGTLRAEMIESGALVERLLVAADLSRASRLLWLNSVRGVVDVRLGNVR